jgi:hypothetical protein
LGYMRTVIFSTAWLPLAAGLLAPTAMAQSAVQPVVANYELTRPAWAPSMTDAELVPRGNLFELGPVRLAPAFAFGGSGAGLSVEAGRQWFARVGVGRSLDSEVVSLGGGYRWADGQALSMQLTHSLAQERTGLSLRYDWPRYYLRVGYDTRLRDGTAETLRFSAGMRF